MLRSILSLWIVFVFALAGTAVLAQTGSESPIQEPAPSAQTGSSTGDPVYQDAPAQEGMAPESSTAGAETSESLPATASPLPLAFAIGVMALGAASALRAYRLRSPR